MRLELRQTCLGLVAACLVLCVSTREVDAADDENVRPDLIVLVGAMGADEFEDSFEASAKFWRKTGERAELGFRQIGPEGDGKTPVKDELKAVLESLNGADTQPLWLVLIGHGTWDGVSADFNLVGPDVDAKEIGTWLRPIDRPIILINGTSSSGPFINRLSAPNRVVVTATRSGSEQNYARFGEYFAAAFSKLESDLDHDDSISVKEAFLKAAADAQRFYKEQGRLATEHALLDDNGDRRGSSMDLVRGSAKRKGEGKVDGEFANRFALPANNKALRLTPDQISRRDTLESTLRDLSVKFEGRPRSEQRQAALPILLELAELYEEASRSSSAAEKE